MIFLFFAVLVIDLFRSDDNRKQFLKLLKDFCMVKVIGTMRTIILVSFLFGLAASLDQGRLYPFGEGRDLVLPHVDDVSTGEITLQTPVYFYDEVYTSIYVS